MPRNIKIKLAYDGSAFFGWQVQPGLRTVQGCIEDGLQSILGQPARITASGRTDTGVHAMGQVFNFYTDCPIPCDGLVRAMNSVLPDDITIIGALDVGEEFHARYNARAKCYSYIIDRSDLRSPLLSRYSLHHPGALDIPAMQKAAGYFIGEHDFRAFMASGSSVKTTRREIFRSEFIDDKHRLSYIIMGSGFLRHMVRNLVGTLLQVGRGEIEAEYINNILASCDRSEAGPTAPAQGLYMVGVEY